MNTVNFRIWLALAGCATVPSSTLAQSLYSDHDNPSDWTRNFRLGAAVGFNIKAKFKTTGSFLVTGAGAGSANKFDDGYVLPDNSGSPDGLTWNWGYDNSSQL